MQKLIAAGGVRVDGPRARRPGTILRGGETIEIAPVSPPVPAGVEPEAIALDVLYEDEHAVGHQQTAGDGGAPGAGKLARHAGERPPASLARAAAGPRSGAAWHRASARQGHLGRVGHRQGPGDARRRWERSSAGARSRSSTSPSSGAACARSAARSAEPIGRNPVHRTRMAVRRGGREALTAFEVIERFDEITMVRLFPRTGRTHQLRVHLAADRPSDRRRRGVRPRAHPQRRGADRTAGAACRADRLSPSGHRRAHALHGAAAAGPGSRCGACACARSRARAQLDNYGRFSSVPLGNTQESEYMPPRIDSLTTPPHPEQCR